MAPLGNPMIKKLRGNVHRLADDLLQHRLQRPLLLIREFPLHGLRPLLLPYAFKRVRALNGVRRWRVELSAVGKDQPYVVSELFHRGVFALVELRGHGPEVHGMFDLVVVSI